jgi:hypothetical protein
MIEQRPWSVVNLFAIELFLSVSICNDRSSAAIYSPWRHSYALLHSWSADGDFILGRIFLMVLSHATLYFHSLYLSSMWLCKMTCNRIPKQSENLGHFWGSLDHRCKARIYALTRNAVCSSFGYSLSRTTIVCAVWPMASPALRREVHWCFPPPAIRCAAHWCIASPAARCVRYVAYDLSHTTVYVLCGLCPPPHWGVRSIGVCALTHNEMYGLWVFTASSALPPIHLHVSLMDADTWF